MAWKIFSIGKANNRIEELEKELAAAKAASPDETKLADALTSNEQLATQLSQANTDLASAKQTIGTLTASLEKAQNEVNAVGLALKTACASMKLTPKDGATSAELITAMQDSVSTTLAKLNVAPDKIPVGAVSTTGTDEKVKTKAQFDTMNPVQKRAFFKVGGRLTD